MTDYSIPKTINIENFSLKSHSQKNELKLLTDIVFIVYNYAL